jgi:hypothetical protein
LYHTNKEVKSNPKNWRKNRAPKKKRKGETAVKKGARFVSRMRGAYRVASRLMEKIKNPTIRATFQKRQSPPPTPLP